jgi:PAS domain S-box-containing protein
MAQEILIIIGLALIFSPALYAMRHSVRYKPIALLLFFGLSTKAGHLLLDTLEESPNYATYALFDRSNTVHIVVQESFSSISVALLLAALFYFVVLHRNAELKLRKEQEALQLEFREKAKLTAAIEHASDAVIVTDVKGIVQYVNPAFERITGYPADETVGVHIEERTNTGSGDEQIYAEMWRQIESGSEWYGMFINKRIDGSYYRTQASIAPVRDVHGKTVSYVSVQRDLSREIELEEQVRHAQRMEAVGSLASGMAHNLRTMLSSILGWIEIARSALGNDDLMARSLTNASRVGERATRQITELLTFSRRTDGEARPIHLGNEVMSTLELLRGIVPENVDLQIRISDDEEQILADSDRIAEAVVNMVMNSVQAIEGKGTVEVSVTKYVSHDHGNCIVLAVADDGIGMDPDTRNRIFDPFFTTKAPGEGTGLGLSVVQGIVADHGATLKVDTEPGKGTTVSISFPVNRGTQHAPQ